MYDYTEELMLANELYDTIYAAEMEQSQRGMEEPVVTPPTEVWINVVLKGVMRTENGLRPLSNFCAYQGSADELTEDNAALLNCPGTVLAVACPYYYEF
jgi:SAM-dependent MidA family methyltransferase